VVLMHRGAVLAEGRPAAIASGLPGALVEVLAADRGAVRAALQADPGVATAAVFGVALHARVDRNPDTAEDHVRSVLQSAGLDAEIRVIRPTLEDAFLHLTARESQPAETQ
jgi:ABC-2 type transport system ATP-binding protein